MGMTVWDVRVYIEQHTPAWVMLVPIVAALGLLGWTWWERRPKRTRSSGADILGTVVGHLMQDISVLEREFPVGTLVDFVGPGENILGSGHVAAWDWSRWQCRLDTGRFARFNSLRYNVRIRRAISGGRPVSIVPLSAELLSEELQVGPKCTCSRTRNGETIFGGFHLRGDKSYCNTCGRPR